METNFEENLYNKLRINFCVTEDAMLHTRRERLMAFMSGTTIITDALCTSYEEDAAGVCKTALATLLTCQQTGADDVGELAIRELMPDFTDDGGDAFAICVTSKTNEVMMRLQIAASIACGMIDALPED